MSMHSSTRAPAMSDIRRFWEDAALAPVDASGLRPTARDPYLQSLVETVMEGWLAGGRLLDVGCGDGLSTIRFARRTNETLGVDYVDAFVERARANAAAEGVGSVTFAQADARDLSAVREEHGRFDVVTSIRCLINLSTWENQAVALAQLAQCVEPGGLLLMSEGWSDGFEGLSAQRVRAGLPELKLAEYNTLLNRAQFELEAQRDFRIVGYHSVGFYLFMSRVMMPVFVSPDEPKHDHALNKLAHDLYRSSVGKEEFRNCDYAGVYVLRRRG